MPRKMDRSSQSLKQYLLETFYNSKSASSIPTKQCTSSDLDTALFGHPLSDYHVSFPQGKLTPEILNDCFIELISSLCFYFSYKKNIISLPQFEDSSSKSTLSPKVPTTSTPPPLTKSLPSSSQKLSPDPKIKKKSSFDIQQPYLAKFLAPLSSDAGWGCSVRTHQMLLGRVLLKLRFGPYSPIDNNVQKRITANSILEKFLDNPTSSFSIHSFLKESMKFLGPQITSKGIGKGFSLDVANQILGNLVQKSSLAKQLTISVGTTIFLDTIPSPISPTLILVPLKLGVDCCISKEYVDLIPLILEWPSNVGILAGKGNAALYIVGRYNGTFMCLDPHRVSDGSLSSIADKSEIPKAYRTKFINYIPFDQISPSLSLAFSISSQEELTKLLSNIDNLGTLCIKKSLPKFLLWSEKTIQFTDSSVSISEVDDDFALVDWEE